MSGPTKSTASRQGLGWHLRHARTALFGEGGSEELAQLLRIPPRTWANYEGGVMIPGDVLLAFLELTGVSPAWLLRGGPSMYDPRRSGDPVPRIEPVGEDRREGRDEDFPRLGPTELGV